MGKYLYLIPYISFNFAEIEKIEVKSEKTDSTDKECFGETCLCVEESIQPNKLESLDQRSAKSKCTGIMQSINKDGDCKDG